MKASSFYVILGCILLINFTSTGQTLKYDDVVSLMNSKQYAQAEPFLKKYLSLNETNAHAFASMGIIYQEKAKETEDAAQIVSYLDSALLYYNVASSHLTVAHFTDNRKYYIYYGRRDLKSGEFVVKYEDVLFIINAQKSSITNELLNLCRSNTKRPVQEDLSTATGTPMGSLKTNGKYVALIIGVSDYDNYKLNLANPVSDAREIAAVLIRNYTFDSADVRLLINPGRQQILNELYNYRKILTPKDNLLIFYAGHGMYDDEAGQGYWWPKDADSESPSNWLSNSDLRDQIRGIKSAHTLLIADACFSGGIFRTRGTTSISKAGNDIVSLYKLTSRRAITSGTMTTVPDQSVFFEYLLRSLKNNPSQYLSSQILFDRFRSNVINNTLQVPQDGIISETGDEGGDFIFIRRAL